MFHTRAPFPRAIFGGFVGTLVLTAMMYMGPTMGLPKSDVASMLGTFLSGQPVAGTEQGAWWLGMAVHWMLGVLVFPAIYAFLFSTWIGGSGWIRGLVWGLVLFAAAQMMVAPMMGSGLFTSEAPRAGARVLGSLLGHAVYGLLLGGIAGIQRAPALTERERRAA